MTRRELMLGGMGTLAVCLAVAAPGARGAIRVANFETDQTVRFPVVLLRGAVSDATADSVTVTNTSSRRDTREMAGLACKGRFKALAELVPGGNRLIVRAGKDEQRLTLTYRPQTNPYVVRAVYFTDRSGATDFQTPIPNDPQDYRGKFDTALKLMQAFTAERLNDLGLGRKTFNLELDDRGKVRVHVLKGRLGAAAYHRLDGGQLYGQAGRELARQLPNRRAHNLVIPAFTRFDPARGKALAHTALGGGNLALFGGGDLFTWPDRLADAQKALTDATAVDPKKVFSDSVGRHTYWAIASTTMGAALHELGHTFGLPHSRDVHGIMTRGGDRWNRFFTLVEPPHARRRRPRTFRDDEVARWSPVSAGALAPNRYFALDDRPWRETTRTRARFDRDREEVVVSSPDGIRYVGLWRTQTARGTEAIAPLRLGADGATGPVRIKLADLTRQMPVAEARLRVLDGEGLGTTVDLAELLAGPFVRAWRFAPTFPACRDVRSLPAVDAAKRKAIEASAAKTPLVRSPTPYVDFLALAGSRRQANVAGYALRTIRSDKARAIQLHTGSDDALRMWLAGKLIRSVPTPRAAKADSETTDAKLAAGDNRLLVEVSQGTGGWGLILRITDADGAKLELTDAGRLVPVKAVGAAAR